MYFSNSQASRDLPIPATPMTETRWARPRRRSRGRGPSQAGTRASRPTKGASRPEVRPSPPASDDAQGTPERHGLRLALQNVLAAVLVGDRGFRATACRVAHEHGSGLGGALDARCGVDEVAGDQALAFRADRHRCLAGDDAGPQP